MQQLDCKDGYFVDEQGRQVFLRGVNLCWKTSDAQLIPVDELDTHMQRLRAWSFDYMRLGVTWESLEPHAPGEYD